MRLVVDVGSTDTKVGLVESGGHRPLAVGRLSTEQAAHGPELVEAVGRLIPENGGDRVEQVTLCSVSPSRTHAVREALGDAVPGALVIEIEGFDGLPLLPGPDGYPTGVGADRIGNALGALELLDSDAIVVDAGTATTIDCVGADRVFVGGAIAPGIGSGAEWLRERAPHLPAVPFEPGAVTIGRSTEEALRSGIFRSAMGGTEALLDAIRTEWGRPDAAVIVTGGYATLLAAHSSAFHRVEPNLTLIGLAVAGMALSD